MKTHEFVYSSASSRAESTVDQEVLGGPLKQVLRLDVPSCNWGEEYSSVSTTDMSIQCLQQYIQLHLEKSLNLKVIGDTSSSYDLSSSSAFDRSPLKTTFSSKFKDMLELENSTTVDEVEGNNARQQNETDSDDDDIGLKTDDVDNDAELDHVQKQVIHLSSMTSTRAVEQIIISRFLKHILISCSRTIAGGDAYAVISKLYGGEDLLLCSRNGSKLS